MLKQWKQTAVEKKIYLYWNINVVHHDHHHNNKKNTNYSDNM